MNMSKYMIALIRIPITAGSPQIKQSPVPISTAHSTQSKPANRHQATTVKHKAPLHRNNGTGGLFCFAVAAG